MKNVLIISPHFPPINSPDMQRVRMALPFLREQGWEPTVLAVSPESVEGGVLEPRLLTTFPADIRVIRVRGISAALTRRIGVGSLWWRCRRALTRAGDQLLAAKKLDLVFISTTQFGAFSLGPRWRARFGVPYVLDYHDPWITDHYQRTGIRPPGGRFRFAVSQWSARRQEPRALRDAACVIVVSPGYIDTFTRTYSWFDPARATVLPFGAASSDFDGLADYRPQRPLIDFQDGSFHHVCTGRVGPTMARSIRILLRAFKKFRDTHASEAARMRFHFIGTAYASGTRASDSVAPLAREEGVAEHVTEHCERVPFFDALYYLRNAGAVIAIGSDDADYSASKIFSYVLAQRPTLLIFHRDSPALAFAEDVSAGVRFGFGDASTGDNSVAEDVYRRWFVAGAASQPASFDHAAFAAYSAATLTTRLTAVFDQCVRETRLGRNGPAKD